MLYLLFKNVYKAPAVMPPKGSPKTLLLWLTCPQDRLLVTITLGCKICLPVEAGNLHLYRGRLPAVNERASPALVRARRGPTFFLSEVCGTMCGTLWLFYSQSKGACLGAPPTMHWAPGGDIKAITMDLATGQWSTPRTLYAQVSPRL